MSCVCCAVEVMRSYISSVPFAGMNTTRIGPSEYVVGSGIEGGAVVMDEDEMGTVEGMEGTEGEDVNIGFEGATGEFGKEAEEVVEEEEGVITVVVVAAATVVVVVVMMDCVFVELLGTTVCCCC